MKPIISINPELPGNYYAIFYLLAFLTGFVLLMWEGRKRKYPIIQWMLVIITAFLFFIIGCRIVRFSLEEWRYVFRLESIPYGTGRSVLGGILLSVPGILIAKKLLRFNYSMVDAFALVLPLALVIQRFGCLMAGCCYGSPTSLPWAIQYSASSHAFVHQLNARILSPESVVALPVHPVQLYEVVCCFFIIVIIIQLRKMLKVPGNLFLASIALYGVARFFLEFWRGSHGLGNRSLYLTDAQLAIAVIVPLLFLLIYKREKRGSEINSVQRGDSDYVRLTAFLLHIILLFVLVSPWLNKTEILTLKIFFTFMFIAIFWSLFKWITIPQYRFSSLVLPVLALFLMSQALPDAENSKPIDVSYNSISVGIIGGSADLIYGDDYTESCDDPGNRTAYANDFNTVAVGYSHTRQNDIKSTTWGLNVFIVDHVEHTNSDRIPGFPTERHQFSGVGFNPYAQFDYTKFGVGLGLHVGKFSSIVPVDENEFSSVKQRNIYPAFSIRGGDRTHVYVEYKFANHFPSSFPALNHMLYMGFGTTRRDKIWRGGGIKIGTASNAAVFVSTTTAIGEAVLLETFFGGLGGIGNPYDFTHTTIGALSLHVKFGKK
jgi:prolipoprotein diacylglyceryltransferase